MTQIIQEHKSSRIKVQEQKVQEHKEFTNKEFEVILQEHKSSEVRSYILAD